MRKVIVQGNRSIELGKGEARCWRTRWQFKHGVRHCGSATVRNPHRYEETNEGYAVTTQHSPLRELVEAQPLMRALQGDI